MPEGNENIQLNEIRELEKELAEKKVAFEKEILQTENKEAEITKENLQEVSSRQTVPTQQTTTASDDEDKTKSAEKDFKKIKNLDTARRVEILSALAFEKGISYSISVARNLNDAYLLDELHDRLVGELHDELVKKGKLKEI